MNKSFTFTATKSPRMSTSQNVLVLVNLASSGYNDFLYYTEPYLKNFGVPYDIADMNSRSYTDYDFNNYALILFGHHDVFNFSQYPGVLSKLERSLINGVGLFSLDISLFNNPSNLTAATSTVNLYASDFTVVKNTHYISCLHAVNEKIGLYNSVPVSYNSRLVNNTVLVTGGSATVLEVGIYGSGRMVRWNNTLWMDINYKGPVACLDDFIWKGMAWAARKPFVIQGMPHYVTFRVDDVYGCGSPPLYWITNANNHGFIPWVGLDISEMSSEAISQLKTYANSGLAVVSPHSWTGVADGFMWFNHTGDTFGSETGVPFTDAQMQQNENALRNWFNTHDFAMSKLIVPHWYEMGANSAQSMLNLGVEFVLTFMPPGQFLTNGGNALLAGPYREYQTWDRFTNAESQLTTDNNERAVYYADIAPFDSRLFLVGTEIRDDAGYEWWPDNDVAGSIGRGTRQLKRSFDSMVLATLFTHEGASRIENVEPSNIEREFAGIQDNISSYFPIPITLDQACKYIRAKTRLTLTDMLPSGSNYAVYYSGTNDMATKGYKFINNGSDGIDSVLFDIPQSNGSGMVIISGNN